VTARAAGLLLHPTSLPSRFGIGDFGPEAGRFVDWAAEAGARLWQVLPLHPPGPGESPYGSTSAFAGNPFLISPERLAEEGLLTAAEISEAAAASGGYLDAAAVRASKGRLLRAAWARFERETPAGRRDEFETFRASPSEASWLPDWALFAALSGRQADAAWVHWPAALARREPDALREATRELAGEIRFQEWLQFLFRRHWNAVREGARGRGIAIVGDVPIYVSHHSADVWVHRDLFALDAGGRADLVAGVPPDYFSETGQLWGYPLYRWDRMKADGFSWWVERLRAALRLADVVRVDHFRGFAGYWEVPAGARTAAEGRWAEGPGLPFFAALREAFGALPLIAEDLGTITPDVKRLLAETGIPGMKVLQFAFSEEDSPHAPHRHVENAVVYTGTHDNDTARGWFAALPPEDRRRVLEYLGGDGGEIEWDLIRAALASVADRAIVPLQDVFSLGSEARMNMPGMSANNWRWRAKSEDFTAERAGRFRRLVELTGRLE
jgi:4-alpha-glucanotransferase